MMGGRRDEGREMSVEGRVAKGETVVSEQVVSGQ